MFVISTRNHFPLQQKRQIFPQKGNETKYLEVMCYKREMHDTFITFSKGHIATPLESKAVAQPATHPHVSGLPVRNGLQQMQGL